MTPTKQQQALQQATTSQAENEMDLAPEVRQIKESLLAQKSEILNRNNEFKQAQLDISKMSDEGDQTAQELQNNISIHLHERERKSLLMIEKTLSKIDSGSYGECESCGDRISIKRLQARPLTPFCINCMEDLEEASHQSGLLQ
ncbi:MAG: TraR/DksA family transcriptional regulator [Pseudobdellovibrio sp.]